MSDAAAQDTHGDAKLVGIVLVSHSGPVATAVAELAAGLAGGSTAPIAAAGGTEDGGLGT
ncbi:PTS fructose transporter subunit IIA, partial [Streptomyces sp. T-3]|nr:PTS fructose transporter subunit IIA [Streptomyces sp. T-3]